MSRDKALSQLNGLAMEGTLMPPESKLRQELHPAEKADWFEFILDRFSEPASDADKEPHGKIQPMLG